VLTLTDIRLVLYPSMGVGVWMKLSRLYGVIERSRPLGDEDRQSSALGEDVPKWEPGIRNALQHDKDAVFLD
jgi:hypothetical protein